MNKKLYEMSFNEFKMYISNQSDKQGNSVAIDDFSRDGMTEYSYPYIFKLEGYECRWSLGKRHTKGRSLNTHYELWGHSPLTGDYKVATGALTKGKLFKFFKDLHERLIQRAMLEGLDVPERNLKTYKLGKYETNHCY